MNVVWIIGNGFDLNLGLETGYRAFIERAYMVGTDPDGLRESLIDAVREDPLWKKGELWSDLEVLLGKATKFYSLNDGRFDRTFEQMQVSFVRYVHTEESKLPDPLPDEAVDEFWDSMCHFSERIVEADRNKIKLKKTYESSIKHQFISLNYTTAFDRFLQAAKKSHAPFDERSPRGVIIRDSAGEILHLHGILEGDEGRGIVFGVASRDQIANEEFASDARFIEKWVKSGKNEIIYGNVKTDQMKSLIRAADTICILGSSLGESDEYIWHEAGSRLKSSSLANLILFEYGLPDRQGPYASVYQQKRDEAYDRFSKAAGLSAKDMVEIRKRSILVPLSDVFNMEIDLSSSGGPNSSLSNALP